MEHCSNKNDNVSPSTVHQKYYAGQEIMTQGHYEYSSNTTYYKQKNISIFQHSQRPVMLLVITTR